MSAITKERIELFIKNPLDNGLTRGEQMELARIALASLEAEPIGFRCRRNDNLGDWSYVYHREPDDFERKHLVIEGIYAAPPAPVVPEEKPMPNPLSMLEREITQLIGDAQEATVTGYELIAEAWRLMDGQDPKTSDWHSKASKYLNSNIVEKVDDDRIEVVKAVLRRLAGNSPVTPDGWVMVPKRLTAENGAKGALSGEFSETTFISCLECFGDDDCDTCDGSGRIEIKVPVTWSTIKSIWDKGIEYFAAKPSQEVK
ncbi:TPA: DUF550 domain-containing protein [Escherichia coli]|nr:DUF550 domain-containing protein [Escherichia coli]